jgi:serine/threonine protein kinase
MASTFHDPALQTWLSEFEAGWDGGRLAARAAELPPQGHPMRLPLLVGMVNIDLRRRWRRGERVSVESYLQTYPELGTPQTVPLDLLHAEYEARLECGAPADLSEFARRFSRDLAEVAQRFQPTQAAPAVPDAATLAPAATPAPVPAQPGRLPEHFGRYHILKELGRGGMGAVYLARDGQLDRLVALKVPHFSPDDATALERFHREAKVAATLTHPNLCPVYDVGALDGVHYLTMPFIEGRPLSALVRPGMPEAEAADLVRRLALALEAAHQKGVIHRDLKPGNVMLNEHGDPVVMDFGLARRANRDDVRLTQSGIVVGTPAYMPPEQLEGAGAPLGPACDIYSLGVILYELLTARLPFQGTVAQLICQVMMEPPPPPSRFRPDLDVRLDAICLKALAKKPEQRYPSMAALAAELQQFLSEPPPPAVLPVAIPVEPKTRIEPPSGRRKRRPEEPPSGRRKAARPERGPRPRKRRWLTCLLIFAGLLLVCCGLPVGVPVLFAPRVSKWAREKAAWAEHEFARQEEWNALASSWKPPADEVFTTHLFTEDPAGYALQEQDDRAAVPEFNITLPGRRARYAAPDGGSVELFVYRPTPAEKQAVYQRVMDTVKSHGSGHFISGSPDGPRVVYSIFSEEDGVLWYGHGWLFFARSRDQADPQGFLLKFLPVLQKQRPPGSSSK